MHCRPIRPSTISPALLPPACSYYLQQKAKQGNYFKWLRLSRPPWQRAGGGKATPLHLLEAEGERGGAARRGCKERAVALVLQAQNQTSSVQLWRGANTLQCLAPRNERCRGTRAASQVHPQRHRAQVDSGDRVRRHGQGIKGGWMNTLCMHMGGSSEGDATGGSAPPQWQRSPHA